MQCAVCLLLSGASMAWAGAAFENEPGCQGAAYVELLREPRFEKGVRPPTNGTNREGPGATCLPRWEEALPSTPEASWQFVTVAETTRFCDNPDTPRVGGGRVIYASKDGAKRFEIDRAAGSVRFVFDTEAEWRNGCNLSLPWNGAEPRYLGGRAWNWPHFLLSQAIVDPHAEDGRLRPGRYEEVLLAFQAELLDSAKGKPAQCPPGSWGGQRIPDHCLFYAALVLLRESPRPPEGVSPARIYALYPLFYSEGGERYDVPLAPWLGDDPAEAAVYFTPNHVCLEQGRAVDVSIDAPGLLEEAVGFINARHDAALWPGDYYLESLLIGWEVWGAYRTELRLGGLSLKASSGAASGK